MNWIYKSESQQSLVMELDEITKEVDTDRKNKQALEHSVFKKYGKSGGTSKEITLKSNQ